MAEKSLHCRRRTGNMNRRHQRQRNPVQIRLAHLLSSDAAEVEHPSGLEDEHQHRGHCHDPEELPERNVDETQHQRQLQEKRHKEDAKSDKERNRHISPDADPFQEIKDRIDALHLELLLEQRVVEIPRHHLGLIKPGQDGFTHYQQHKEVPSPQVEGRQQPAAGQLYGPRQVH